MTATRTHKKPLTRRMIEAFRTLIGVESQKDFPLPISWHVANPFGFQWHMIDYDAYAREGFSQNEVIYGAIKYKFDAIAQAPLRVYEGHPDNAVLYEDLKHPLAKLALRPNDYMSRVEFMQHNEVYLNLHGNSFTYITGIDDGLPLAMYPLRPDFVQIITKRTKSGRVKVGYAYFPDGYSKENYVPILPKNMLHVKFPNPLDPLQGQGYGLSPMSAAARSIDTDNAMTSFLANFFQNQGIMPGGIITLPYEADSEDIDKLRSQIEEKHGGADKWGKPIVIDGAGSYSHMTPSFNEMGLEGIDLRNIRRMTTVFGVPGRLLGLDEANSTYNNIAEAKEDFWQRTMYAELLLFEEEMRHKIRISDDNLFLRFDVSGIPAFAEDTTSQISNYVQLVSNFVPPNQAKRIAGLDIPDIKGGDVSYMPGSLVPVQDKLNPPESDIPQLPDPDDTPDKPTGNMDDIETPSEEEDSKKSGSEHLQLDDGNDLVHYSDPNSEVAQVIQSWDQKAKRSIMVSQLAIMDRHVPYFEKGARAAFKAQKASVLAIYNDHKRKAMKARKNINLLDADSAIRMFLFSQGMADWAETFGPLILELAVELRKDWKKRKIAQAIPDFDAIFTTRASIEGEAWFSGYTLKFASDINNVTHEGIHSVIRDGLADGMGTDQIGNKLELLFDQYLMGGTSPDDWSFMLERMPPYRTEMIARTETHGAMSASNHFMYKRIGATQKEWLSTNDARTRPTHVQAGATYIEGGSIGPIDIDDPFIVGGYEMMHPGDKSAPLAEFINCRCTELPVIPET